MEDLQLALTPSRVDQRNHGIMLTNWRVGQTISALVSERLPNGNVLLTVGPQSFITSGDIPVQQGTKIKLEVQQIEPKLLLRLVDGDDFIQKQNFRETSPAAAAFSQGRSTSAGLAQLLDLLFKQTVRKFKSAVDTGDISRALLSNTLNAQSINGREVRTALMQSGLFTEALWLANRPDLAAMSTKTILLSLRDKIVLSLRAKNLTPEERSSLNRMLSLIDAAVFQTSHKQISSIPQDGSAPKWLTSIPLLWREEFVEIEIEIEAPDKSHCESEEEWTLRLSFELKLLGEVTIILALVGDGLSVEFQITEQVTDKVTELLPLLRSQLSASGLRLNRVIATPVVTAQENLENQRSNTVDISI